MIIYKYKLISRMLFVLTKQKYLVGVKCSKIYMKTTIFHMPHIGFTADKKSQNLLMKKLVSIKKLATRKKSFYR